VEQQPRPERPGLLRASIPTVTTSSNVRYGVVALFVALLVCACGSSNKISGAKAAYVAKVDPICRDLRSQLGGDLGTDAGKQAAAVADAVGKIMAVPKPAEDSERADLFIAALNNTNLSLQDVDQSRMVNDQTRAQKALDGAKANAQKAAAAAKQYGMVECAQTL
jgi:hypothetical protein